MTTTHSAPAAAASSAANRAANRKGIAWMIVTGLFFVSVTGIIRHLGTDMNPIQAAFLRYAIGLAMLAPLFLRLRAEGALSKRVHLHALRGFIHGIGVMLWFYAMTRLPIAEVMALGFTAPIFTTIGAALFLGERLHMRRIGAVLLGFGGALVILRPGVESIDPGAIAQLIAAPLFAGSFLLTKKLTETDSNLAIVAYLSVFVTITLLPAALVVWRTPSWEELGWLFLTALLATLGHFSLAQAFRSTQITVLQPVQFLQLIWATLLGFYVFAEEPDIWTWIGGGIIVLSASYIVHRETRARRSKIASGKVDVG